MTVLTVDFEDFEGFAGNEGFAENEAPTRIVADMAPVLAHAVREDSGTWVRAERERFG